MDQVWSEEVYAEIRERVSRYFRVYDEKRGGRSILLYIEETPESLELSLSLLREEFKPDYKVYLTRSGGEEGIMVVDAKTVEVKPKIWLHALLFALTVITTGIAGSINYYYFLTPHASWFDWVSLREIGMGFLLFGFPLMAILGVHESGHYLMSRKLGVAASLPYFIPIPPIPGFILQLGTMGAVISMKSPMENRSSLVRIGAAGPLSGFVVAVVVIIVGIFTSYFVPISTIGPDTVFISVPILARLLMPLLGDVEGHLISLSPTFLAGWVGLFVTALNLLPVGQLDGGHIFRAVFKRGGGIMYMVLIMLFGFIAFFVNPFYINFLFIMFVITMLGGVRHPPPLDDVTSLKPVDWGIIVASAVTFILCLPI